MMSNLRILTKTLNWRRKQVDVCGHVPLTPVCYIFFNLDERIKNPFLEKGVWMKLNLA